VKPYGRIGLIKSWNSTISKLFVESICSTYRLKCDFYNDSVIQVLEKYGIVKRGITGRRIIDASVLSDINVIGALSDSFADMMVNVIFLIDGTELFYHVVTVDNIYDFDVIMEYVSNQKISVLSSIGD